MAIHSDLDWQIASEKRQAIPAHARKFNGSSQAACRTARDSTQAAPIPYTKDMTLLQTGALASKPPLREHVTCHCVHTSSATPCKQPCTGPPSSQSKLLAGFVPRCPMYLKRSAAMLRKAYHNMSVGGRVTVGLSHFLLGPGTEGGPEMGPGRHVSGCQAKLKPQICSRITRGSVAIC